PQLTVTVWESRMPASPKVPVRVNESPSSSSPGGVTERLAGARLLTVTNACFRATLGAVPVVASISRVAGPSLYVYVAVQAPALLAVTLEVWPSSPQLTLTGAPAGAVPVSVTASPSLMLVALRLI